ncbi:MAG: DUF1643 domain-containing protein [Bacteroidales bacterium]|nr:DUF1643 domain-containing protein [Bacteroidales bacterium]
MERIHEVNEQLIIKPQDSVVEGNKRKEIRVKFNDGIQAVVIGINPSTAHDGKSDVTLTKTCRYLDSFGVGEVVMLNLFDTISVNQNGIDYSERCELSQYDEILQKADMILVAWGTENNYIKEKQEAFNYLLQYSAKVYCIADEQGNKPRHPSRIKYSYSLEHFFPQPMENKYPVVTLCGSTRFKNAFMEAQKKLTLEGNIVISVGLFGHSGDEEVWEDMDEGTLTKTKEMLDDMHKRKIDMADSIFVINVGGYIGDSTKSEIEYAKKQGKIVRYLEC